jgi:hypothetical protein
MFRCYLTISRFSIKNFIVSMKLKIPYILHVISHTVSFRVFSCVGSALLVVSLCGICFFKLMHQVFLNSDMFSVVRCLIILIETWIN